jgi:hypothetical protein
MTARVGPSEECLKEMSPNEVAFVAFNPFNELFLNKVHPLPVNVWHDDTWILALPLTSTLIIFPDIC